MSPAEAPKGPDMLSFHASAADQLLIRKIARRASELYLKHKVECDRADILMDITATHASGCPLRLQDLLDASDFNLMHDVSGIARHLDRETGQLQDHFRPRFAVAEVHPFDGLSLADDHSAQEVAR